jgi:hypothetical protein
MADETEREKRVKRQLVAKDSPIVNVPEKVENVSEVEPSFVSDLTRLPGDRDNLVEVSSVDAVEAADTIAAKEINIERGVNVSNNSPEETSLVASQYLEGKAPAANKDQIVDNIRRGQIEKGFEQGSLTSKFTEGIAAFLPTIVGAAFGGMKGAQQGSAVTAQLLSAEKQRAALAAGPSEKDQMARERLEISKGQLEQRKKEIELARTRSTDVREDRELRREERDLVRATGLKDKFRSGKRFQSLEGNLKNFDDIENLVVEGKKLPGALASKIARAIAGEVGVLTDQDIKRSQINPDIYNRVKNQASVFFKGEMSETNKKEIVKIVKALRAKAKQKIRDRIEDFSASRSKSIKSKELREAFKRDLLREHGVEDKKDARSRLEELRNKYKK